MLMEAKLQSQVAFHLTGRRPAAGLETVEPLSLRPALLARYRDLTALRYDFPLVLVDCGADGDRVQALSGLVDRLLQDIARGDDAERVTRHVLRLERQLRVLLAEGVEGSLSTLWDMAAERLGVREDESLRDSLGRARVALKIDGALVDCDAALPARLVAHAWRAAQDAKAARFRATVGRLIQKLSDILRADFNRSDAGRSAESLKASIGDLHADLFDFGAMSRLLTKAAPETMLSESRRTRIRALLSVLESQRFYAGTAGAGGGESAYSFVYQSCADALAAYRERLVQQSAVARAMAVAELEIAGEFREVRHAPFFETYGADGLDPADQALFPDYLVCVNVQQLDAAETFTLSEILSAGLPMKVLVQTDDILEESPVGGGHFGFGLRSRQVAHTAMGLNDVYVLQSASSNLFQFRGHLRNGFAYQGPALFSVFSGATGTTGDLPPYLCAAAAMDSRAFPAFAYDPSAGTDWASRFDLQANPDIGLDWPVRSFAYEDEAHQKIAQDLAFTPVDFVACDSRYARHFARVPRAGWAASMIPVGECLARDGMGSLENVPCLLMVGRDDTLQKVIVDDKLMREARRCREMWHSLQELGGIHNSHAQRLLAQERKAHDERAQAASDARVAGPGGATAAAAPAAPSAAAEPDAEKSPGEAYIETPRCTSCNECTGINNKMFAYNENQQAYIADVTAGTYAQLVEAAESCQVSIIHPGKPRDPNEPNLPELVQRAAAFQ
jgi:4Fe-4S single cluster domain of Ferredoxin I